MQQRLQLFRTALETIDNQNARFDRGESTFTMAVNKFADLTTEEWKKYSSGLFSLPDAIPAPAVSASSVAPPAVTSSAPKLIYDHLCCCWWFAYCFVFGTCSRWIGSLLAK